MDGPRAPPSVSFDRLSRYSSANAETKGNILQVVCTLLNGNFSLRDVTKYPLIFGRPICATDPPPPDSAAPAETAEGPAQ
jgi:hypothetical protein